MSSLNIVVRNLPGDPPNILKGIMRNPLKLSPNARVGLSSINVTRQIQVITVDMDSEITVQTKGGPLFKYVVRQGIYVPSDLLIEVQNVLNKSCIPFSNFDRPNSNNSLFGFNPNNMNSGANITGMFLWTGISHSEIVAISTPLGATSVTRYADSFVVPTVPDGSDFVNITPNISFPAPQDSGKLTISPGGSTQFGFTFAKKQSIGSWSSAILINATQPSRVQNISFTATDGTKTIKWGFAFIYKGTGRLGVVNLNISVDGNILTNGVCTLQLMNNTAGANDDISVVPYRIGGRLGACLFAGTSDRSNPFFGISTDEISSVTKIWPNLTFTVTGAMLFGGAPAAPYVMRGIKQTKTTIPPSSIYEPLILNYDQISPLTAAELDNIQLNLKAAAEYEEIRAANEEMGVFITADDLTEPVAEVTEPQNLQVLQRPEAYLIPNEMAEYLGFLYSGIPVGGGDHPYIFNPANSSNTILSETDINGDGAICPIIIASRSIPLRGCAFMDNGSSQDVSILDSIVAVYTSGKSFQGNYRPPLYASVNNKTEMTITDLRFDLLDIDGVSPFEVLPGAVIVINIQGAL